MAYGAAPGAAPLGTLAVGWLGHSGFTETGAGAFNLTAEGTGSVSTNGQSHQASASIGGSF